MSNKKDSYYLLQLEKEKTKRLELKIEYRKHMIDAIMRLSINDSGSESGSDTSSEYPDLEYIKHQKKKKHSHEHSHEHSHKHSTYEDAVKEATSDSLSDCDDLEKSSDIHTDEEINVEKDKINEEEMYKYKEEQLENKIIELFSKIKK